MQIGNEQQCLSQQFNGLQMTMLANSACKEMFFGNCETTSMQMTQDEQQAKLHASTINSSLLVR